MFFLSVFKFWLFSQKITNNLFQVYEKYGSLIHINARFWNNKVNVLDVNEIIFLKRDNKLADLMRQQNN